MLAFVDLDCVCSQLVGWLVGRALLQALTRGLREEFDLHGVPIRVKTKVGANPYHDKVGRQAQARTHTGTHTHTHRHTHTHTHTQAHTTHRSDSVVCVLPFTTCPDQAATRTAHEADVAHEKGAAAPPDSVGARRNAEGQSSI